MHFKSRFVCHVAEILFERRNFILALLIFSLFITGNAQASVVQSFQKISATAGGLVGPLEPRDDFGESISQIGDLDGDGVVDIAVGTRLDHDAGINRGAVYILFMNRDGTVNHEQKISSTQGNFTGVLNDDDNFGLGVAGIGDLNGDGYPDIAVGSAANGLGLHLGVVWILFLNSNGTVKSHQMITESLGGFTGNLDDNDRFGSDLTLLADYDGDGIREIGVSVDGDDDGGGNRGAFYILFMRPNGTVRQYQKISDTQGGFRGLIDNNDLFGSTLSNLGDLDGDGVADIATGAQFDDDGGDNFGAVWILFMNANATVKSFQKISAITGGFTGQLDPNDQFGQSVGAFGDINNDGIIDLAVGAEFDGDGDFKGGATYILTLKRDGTVQNTQKISANTPNFQRTPRTTKFSEFGQAIATPGDLNLDGIPDIIVTADGTVDPGVITGAVYVIFLNGTPSGQINQAPVIAAIADQIVTEGNQLVIPVSATDADGPGPLILSASGTPVDAVFLDNGAGDGRFRWTPPAGAALNSPYTITFSASDAVNALNTRVVNINVVSPGSGGNQRPEIAPIGNQVATEGQLISFNVTATDSDGPGPLVLTATAQPAGIIFSGDIDQDASIFADKGNGDGEFRWTPPAGSSASGPVVITFTATENAGNGLSNSTQVTLLINAANDGTNGGNPGGGGAGGTNTGNGNGSSSGGGGGGSIGLPLLFGLLLLNILTSRRFRVSQRQTKDMA